MLIWAKKSEVDIEVINPIAKMYRENLRTKNLGNILKAWELSVIFRQIKRYFGDRKDISILDFGAGASPFGAYLNHLGYQDVTCLDKKGSWHPKMNEGRYNENYNASVRYVITDIRSDYNAEHDVIFSASVIEHIEEDERIDIMHALARHLASGGLLIHVVDYEAGVNFKELIDNCGIPISYNPKITPGCREFSGVPKYTWWTAHKRMRIITRVAFFNKKIK